MLIFTDRKLAFLATPKTGSTAIEAALRNLADIQFRGRRKHVNAAKFQNHVGPFFSNAFDTELEVVALMRDPVDQLRSWYKYRTRERDVGDASVSTAGISFDQFIEAAISENPPAFAQVGSQHRFLTMKGGLGVDRLFQYERMEVFLDFLEERLGKPVVPDVKNASPLMEAQISQPVLEALKTHRRAEFDLYAELEAAGGMLSQRK